LTVKQIKAKFNTGKIKEYDLLKAKSKTRNQWLNKIESKVKWK